MIASLNIVIISYQKEEVRLKNKFFFNILGKEWGSYCKIQF